MTRSPFDGAADKETSKIAIEVAATLGGPKKPCLISFLAIVELG